MAIRLSGTINDYVGLSTDTKPIVEDDGKLIPAGSRFFEQDTGADYRFNGYAWGEVGRGQIVSNLILEKLDGILTELQKQNGHLQVGSGLDGQEARVIAN